MHDTFYEGLPITQEACRNNNKVFFPPENSMFSLGSLVERNPESSSK